MLVSFMTDTVTRLRAAADRNRYGDDVPGAVAELDIPGCLVVPPGGQLAASTEDVQGMDQVTVLRVLFAPAGTDIRAVDRVRHGGRTYDVVGDPATFPGGLSHIEVNLRAVTG